jgi:cell division protein FtsL
MSKAAFSEVIWWPMRLWLLFLTLNMAIIIAVGVALTNLQMLIFTALLTLGTLLLAYKTRLVITYQDNLLKVGKAKLEKEFMGELRELNESELKIARNTRNNFLAIRFWIKTGLNIEINDKRDPNSNWVISTRRGSELKEKLSS